MPMAQLACPTRHAALQWPAQTALYLSDKTLSFLQLDGCVSQASQWLSQQGLTRGSHLGVISHNSPAMVVLLLACLRTGVVFCPLNPRFTTAQVTRQQQRQHIRQLFTQQKLEQAWQTWHSASACAEYELTPIELDSEAACDMILTSGSTGEPKAVVHCYRNHYFSALGASSQLALSPGDCWLLSLPLFHIGGYAIVIRSLLAGSSMALGEHGQDLLTQLQTFPVSHLSLVNAQLYRLLQQPDEQLAELPLRHLLLGGGPISQQLIQNAQARGFHTWTTYGMSEMSSQITTGQLQAGDRFNSGELLPYRQLKLGTNSELYVKGEVLFLGYYRNNTLDLPLDKQGWFATGDRGRIVQNKLVIDGRCDNMFISGGENIQPETIESCLCQHPAVSQALVVPIPHAEYGYRPVAFVQWRSSPLDQKELKQWLRNQLAGFLCPDLIFPWPEDLTSGGLKPSRLAFRNRALELTV